MLTKQEVERTRSLVVRELDDYGDIAGLRKLSDQAISAIDLDAENARLKADLTTLTDVKRVADNLVEMERINRMGDLAAENKLLRAKLDAVRELAMEETYGTANMSWSKAMKNILGILDRDGDGE